MIMHRDIQYENIIYRVNDFGKLPLTPKPFTARTKPASGCSLSSCSLKSRLHVVTYNTSKKIPPNTQLVGFDTGSSTNCITSPLRGLTLSIYITYWYFLNI